jgi:hypothetical protein
MNYALKAIYHLVQSSRVISCQQSPLGQPNSRIASTIMANRFSPQSTPIASVADAQAARPTRGMLERGTRGHFLRWKGNKLMAANFFGSPIRSMELMVSRHTHSQSSVPTTLSF